jgi:hypothetical protein
MLELLKVDSRAAGLASWEIRSVRWKRVVKSPFGKIATIRRTSSTHDFTSDPIDVEKQDATGNKYK